MFFEEIFPLTKFLNFFILVTALETIKSCFDFICSTLLTREDTLFKFNDSLTALTTFIFLFILSTNKNWHFGNNIANGIPGKPPPVPTSRIVVLSLNLITLAIDRE